MAGAARRWSGGCTGEGVQPWAVSGDRRGREMMLGGLNPLPAGPGWAFLGGVFIWVWLWLNCQRWPESPAQLRAARVWFGAGIAAPVGFGHSSSLRSQAQPPDRGGQARSCSIIPLRWLWADTRVCFSYFLSCLMACQ